jgi:TonB family protein
LRISLFRTFIAAAITVVSFTAPSHARAATPLSPAALCPKPDAPAQFVDGEEPDTPAAAHGARGMAFVSVALAADGAVLSTAVTRSSRNAALDAAAVEGAKEASYAPACRSGKPVKSTYLYVARFGT